jgi:hypothetical protein
VKLSLCLTKHYAMKTYWEIGGISPRILEFGTRKCRNLSGSFSLCYFVQMRMTVLILNLEMSEIRYKQILKLISEYEFHYKSV